MNRILTPDQAKAVHTCIVALDVLGATHTTFRCCNELEVTLHPEGRIEITAGDMQPEFFADHLDFVDAYGLHEEARAAANAASAATIRQWGGA